METRRLKAFIKMVETGTLTRAAEQLGIAQPSLSQQVLALEADFGAKLLDRSKRGVTATPAGELLYRHAQIILKQLDQAHAEIGKTSHDVAGVVAVGMVASVASVLTLPLLVGVRERFPAVRLRLSEGPSSLLNELTMNGRLDFALVAGDAMQKGLKSQPLFVEELVLVSARGWGPTDCQADFVTVASLADHALVLPSRGTGPRTLVDRTFARVGFEPRIVAELDSLQGLATAASANIGSTIVPWAAARHMPGDFEIRKITEPELERTVSVCKPESLPTSDPAAAVESLILLTITDMIAAGQWPGARVLHEDPTTAWS